MALLPGHEASFKSQTNTFLNDPKSQNEVFGCFLKLSLLDWLDIANCGTTQVFQDLATLPDHEGSFKDHTNAFLNSPKSLKRV